MTPAGGDGPSTFLLLREHPRPVAASVLAGEVPDLEVPGLRVLDPYCYRVGVVRVVLFGHKYGADLFFNVLFRRRISGEVPQVVLAERFADNWQVLISGQESRLDLTLRPDGPFPPRAVTPRAGGMDHFPRAVAPRSAGWATSRGFCEIASCRESRCHSPSGASCTGTQPPVTTIKSFCRHHGGRGEGVPVSKPGWSVVGSQPIASSGLRCAFTA
jgi:hypothetical protein